MAIWIGGTQGTRTQTEELVIRFKTSRPAGLLLLTSAETSSSDRLEIGLVAGRVRANVKLGEREKVTLPIHAANPEPTLSRIEPQCDSLFLSSLLFQLDKSINRNLLYRPPMHKQTRYHNNTKNLLAGQGVLNDNNWHTVRFSRRASNLRLQVDGAPPVRGTLCMYQQHHILPYYVS